MLKHWCGSEADWRAEDASTDVTMLVPSESRDRACDSPDVALDAPKGCEGPLAAALTRFASDSLVPSVAFLEPAYFSGLRVEVALLS